MTYEQVKKIDSYKIELRKKIKAKFSASSEYNMALQDILSIL